MIAPTWSCSARGAINAVPRVEERLELTLWRLGDRFGRVTPEGILLRLGLTHELLVWYELERRGPRLGSANKPDS